MCVSVQCSEAVRKKISSRSAATWHHERERVRYDMKHHDTAGMARGLLLMDKGNEGHHEDSGVPEDSERTHTRKMPACVGTFLRVVGSHGPARVLNVESRIQERIQGEL